MRAAPDGALELPQEYTQIAADAGSGQLQGKKCQIIVAWCTTGVILEGRQDSVANSSHSSLSTLGEDPLQSVEAKKVVAVLGPGLDDAVAEEEENIP